MYIESRHEAWLVGLLTSRDSLECRQDLTRRHDPESNFESEWKSLRTEDRLDLEGRREKKKKKKKKPVLNNNPNAKILQWKRKKKSHGDKRKVPKFKKEYHISWYFKYDIKGIKKIYSPPPLGRRKNLKIF